MHSSLLAVKLPLRLFGVPQLIRRNLKVITIPLLPKTYDISFNFKPTKFLRGWSSILHMTTGGNCCQRGKRVPGIFIKYNRIGIFNSIGNNGNWQFLSKPLVLNKLVRVRLTQTLEGGRYVYKVYINSELLKSVVNSKPLEFKKVQVWLGDPWYKAQPGYLANLLIAPIGKIDIYHFGHTQL